MIRSRLLFLLFLLLPLLASPLAAELGGDVITFTHGVDRPTDMTGATEVIGPNVDDAIAGTYPIGFTFNFGGGNLNYTAGTDYTDFSVSSNGWMTLGVTAPSDALPTNQFNSTTTYPMIAAFWDDMHTGPDGYVRYKTIGTAPNRVLVVEYRLRRAGAVDGGLYNFEIRLHEGSNKYEFLYKQMAPEKTSASIVVAERKDNFSAVQPPFPPHSTDPFYYYIHTISTGIDMASYSIPTNTTYCLTPCVWDVSIVGDLRFGGTTDMRDGDTIMRGLTNGVDALIRTTPFLVYQKAPVCTLRCVEFELSGPHADEYEVRPINLTTGDDFTCITPEDTLVYVVDFTPKADGPRTAYLRVYSDAGIDAFDRTYVLYAGAGVGPPPAGAGKLALTPPKIDDLGCVGQEVIAKPMVLKNSGTGPITVNRLDAYRLQSDPVQGTPNRELLRDRNGDPIPTDEYFLTTDGPATAPQAVNKSFPGITIAPDAERTIWVNFVAGDRSDRSARLYLQTDAPNVTAVDASGTTVVGLVTFDLHGKGSTPILAGVPQDGRPAHLQFGAVEVRAPLLRTIPITNDGACDLRILRREFRFVEGDITEFELRSILPNTPVIDGFYVLPPGFTDSVTIAFRPASYGSRRATIRLVTNDSTLGIPGVVAPGTYLWDFFGRGTFGIEVRDLELPPAIIGGNVSRGSFRLENTALENIVVTNIEIEGGSDIGEDAERSWPALPLVIAPGETLDLGVMLAPSNGAEPGLQQGRIVIRLGDGRTVDAEIFGIVGSRVLLVGPGALFANDVVAIGETLRRTLVVTNDGTLPVRLDGLEIEGPAAAAYAVAESGARILEPGSSLFYEVVLTPISDGSQEATLKVHSNATDGTIEIRLAGSTSTTSPVGGGSGARTGGAQVSPGNILFLQ